MTWLARDLNNFLNNTSEHVDNMDMNKQVVRLLNVVDFHCQNIHNACKTCGCKGLDAVPLYGGNTMTNAFRQGRSGLHDQSDESTADAGRAGTENGACQ